MTRLITYTNGEEVIVTTIENEHEIIRSFFSKGGRNIDSYDRKEITDLGVRVSTALRIG